MGQNPETDRVVEEAIATLRKLGAVVVDNVAIPDYVLKAQAEISNVLHHSEFKASVGEYLKSDTKAGYPKSLDDLVARSNDPATHYRSSGKAVGFKYTASAAKDMNDPAYLAIKNEGLAMVKAGGPGGLPQPEARRDDLPDFAPHGRAHRSRRGPRPQSCAGGTGHGHHPGE